MTYEGMGAVNYSTVMMIVISDMPTIESFVLTLQESLPRNNIVYLHIYDNMNALQKLVSNRN